jgi:NAD(P)-dependent dehydrogenase (short-subunit alcohol dehydrogenase family)
LGEGKFSYGKGPGLMDLELKDKVAIVTGGTQGIGRATALRLAQEGARVVIAARGKERLDAVAAEVRAAGGRVAAVQADVAKTSECERVIAEALRSFGRIDILVNNAGTSLTGEFESVTDALWQQDLDLKLFART